MRTEISGLTFYLEPQGAIVAERVSSFAPEQWTFFHRGKEVAFLRLRHGSLTVECNDGSTVLEADLYGAPNFSDDEQRRHYLTLAAEKFSETLAMEAA